MNSIKEFTSSVKSFNSTVEKIGYWLNPKNLITEAWEGIEAVIDSPDTAVFLIVCAIVSVIFRALDVKLPLKLTFWAWVAYWILRGFIFV